MAEKISQAARVLRIIDALKGKTLIGLSNKELAEGLNESAVNISRAVEILINEGMVVRIPETGRFALSIRLLNIAITHLRETEKMQARLAEIDQRINAGIF